MKPIQVLFEKIKDKRFPFQVDHMLELSVGSIFWTDGIEIKSENLHIKIKSDKEGAYSFYGKRSRGKDSEEITASGKLTEFGMKMILFNIENLTQ